MECGTIPNEIESAEVESESVEGTQPQKVRNPNFIGYRDSRTSRQDFCVCLGYDDKDAPLNEG